MTTWLDPDHWRQLVPELTLSTVLMPPEPRFDFTEQELAVLCRDLRSEGYLITRPVVPPAVRARLLTGIDQRRRGRVPRGAPGSALAAVLRAACRLRGPRRSLAPKV
jgi:hypothetical protein